MKKLFLLDIKKIDDNLQQSENSINKTLQRYESKIGDYENNVLTEAVFIRLGWSNKYKDSIFSFRTLFCKIVEIYSLSNKIKLDNGAVVRFYFRDNVLKYTINDISKELYRYNKETLYKKATTQNSSLYKVLEIISNDEEGTIWNKIAMFSELSDSLSNFTPHPGYPFNQAKGCITEVVDSLNLMVDKIQECIDNEDNLEYIEKGYKKIIKLEQLKNWKEWLINNQSVYCLNDFYSVTDDNKIVGTKLFNDQSLKCPLPQKKEDILESLNKIINILSKRAERMNDAFH